MTALAAAQKLPTEEEILITEDQLRPVKRVSFQ